MYSKIKKAGTGGAVSAGCKASNVGKTSITHSKEKIKSIKKRKCEISKCVDKRRCTDCPVEKCERRCLNSPEKCRLAFAKEGATK